MDLTAPVRRRADDPDLGSILDLLRAGFAYMDGRIDPPSSLHRMDVDDIRTHCKTVRGPWTCLSSNCRRAWS